MYIEPTPLRVELNIKVADDWTAKVNGHSGMRAIDLHITIIFGH